MNTVLRVVMFIVVAIWLQGCGSPRVIVVREGGPQYGGRRGYGGVQTRTEHIRVVRDSSGRVVHIERGEGNPLIHVDQSVWSGRRQYHGDPAFYRGGRHLQGGWRPGMGGASPQEAAEFRARERAYYSDPEGYLWGEFGGL